MNIEQLFSAALGIVDPWYIKSVNFDSASKKLALFQNEWVEQNLFTFEKFNFPVKK